MSDALQTVNLFKEFPQTKRYRDLLLHPFKKVHIPVLKDINLQVNKGELFGLLGPNGAGKTTLIKIFSTLILPTEGHVYVNGYDVTKDEKEIKKTIGYVVCEERSFYWRLTGRQNLNFFAVLNNIPKARIEKRITELLDLIDLGEDIDRPFQHYSSGMKQKLAIARGLLTNPQVLFLDEPTKNLDPIVTHNLRLFIKNLIVGEMGKTVILATNNMQEAEELCGRIAILNKGEVKLCGDLGEIRQNLTGKVIYTFKLKGPYEFIKNKVNSLPFPGKVLSVLPESSFNNNVLLKLDVYPGEEAVAEVIKLMINSNIKIHSFYQEELSLTEIFTHSVE